MTAWNSATALDVLAAAYANAGLYDQAVAAADKALALKPSLALSQGIVARRNLYTQGCQRSPETA